MVRRQLRMSFRLTSKMKKALQLLADKYETSESCVICSAIQFYAKSKGVNINEL